MKKIECIPQTRRNMADLDASKEPRSIYLQCGRYFFPESLIYKLKEKEKIWDFAYPWDLTNPNYIFPLPNDKGVITIYEPWGALNKEQIKETCPFYDPERGCLKALELGVTFGNREQVEEQKKPRRRRTNQQVEEFTMESIEDLSRPLQAPVVGVPDPLPSIDKQEATLGDISSVLGTIPDLETLLEEEDLPSFNLISVSKKE